MTLAFDPHVVTLPAIYARAGDTLLQPREQAAYRIEGVEYLRRKHREPADRILFTLDGAEPMSRQAGEYVTLRRDDIPEPRGELRRVLHPNVKAFVYRGTLVVCDREQWRVRFRDGRGVHLFGSGFHMRTEDEWRREAVRVIDAVLDRDGHGSAWMDEVRVLEAEFLTGTDFPTAEPREVPTLVSRGRYAYRGFHIVTDPGTGQMFRDSASPRIVDYDGKVVATVQARRYGTRDDEQARTAAAHLDTLLDT